MIPYAILSFFLTSLVVFNDPNFITEKHFNLIPSNFMENLAQIANAIIIITIFEFSFRAAFIIKRKILPKSDKKLEDSIETEVEEITKARFKKMEQKQNETEKKIDDLLEKLKDAEKTHS